MAGRPTAPPSVVPRRVAVAQLHRFGPPGRCAGRHLSRRRWSARQRAPHFQRRSPSAVEDFDRVKLLNGCRIHRMEAPGLGERYGRFAPRSRIIE